jgi:hypothetical protein
MGGNRIAVSLRMYHIYYASTIIENTSAGYSSLKQHKPERVVDHSVEFTRPIFQCPETFHE